MDVDQMMYNYKEILDWKYASSDYTITDAFDYDTLVWNDSTEKPSREFLENKIDVIKASQTNVVRVNRAGEYPSIGDQLDALFHAGVFPPEMAAQIQAIKDKYPKL
jgi:hypothetical protein